MALSERNVEIEAIPDVCHTPGSVGAMTVR
jgi:hypothetical protein